MSNKPLKAYFIGDLYISIDNDVYPVHGYNKRNKLKKYHGYIVDNVVYIYMGKLSKAGKTPKPGIYKNELNEYVFVEPSPDEIENIYSVDHIVEVDEDDILEQVTSNPDMYQQQEDIDIINNNRELFIPNITEEDDFLKYLVKTTIIEKEINISDYKSKFPSEYALNNMKSGLKRSTKMTVPNFNAWCEILGVKWSITISDKGTDNIAPLKEPITITSDEF